MNLIFVYGTLKRGNAIHSVIEKCRFIGKAITLQPIFKLFCNGSFPHAINTDESGYRIVGELYRVSDEVIVELDLIGGHPTIYTRRYVEFMLEDCSRVGGQMYIYNNHRACKHYTEIKSGHWQEKSGNSTEKV